ncbi:MAG: hypothetical protein ACQEP3_00590 [Patescibacteria group bacterium]
MSEPCPDCDTRAIFGNSGDGNCSNCHGAGEKSGFMDSLIPSSERSEHEQCPKCGGSGVCPTCGGDGFI